MLDTSNFTGTEQYHRITALAPIKATDGVLYVAEQAKAFWLVDAIASHQCSPTVKKEAFQTWTLTKHADSSATLLCTDGNYNEITRQEIEWTDYPDATAEMWLIDGVLLLPSEY